MERGVEEELDYLEWLVLLCGIDGRSWEKLGGEIKGLFFAG